MPWKKTAIKKGHSSCPRSIISDYFRHDEEHFRRPQSIIDLDYDRHDEEHFRRPQSIIRDYDQHEEYFSDLRL